MTLTTPATAPAPTVVRTLVLSTPGRLGSSWQRTQKLSYGRDDARLGTSPGGENVAWGPGYGAQVPDRTWWYADAAKKRLAHYDDSGRYLGQVKLPKKYLAQGQYFQWADPMALADGSVVLTSTTIDSPALLRLTPSRQLKTVSMARYVHLVVGDGASLYGFDTRGRQVRVNPLTGRITTVKAFKGQGARPFTLTAAAGHLLLTRPGVNLRFDLVDADHPSLLVHPSVEVAMGSTGKLWILVTGIVEIRPDEARDVIGIFWVDADGNSSPARRVRTPSSDSDPGDGKHLGIRHGSSRPTLTFVDTDAVRTYRKN